jgi:hypothetical protein
MRFRQQIATIRYWRSLGLVAVELSTGECALHRKKQWGKYHLAFGKTLLFYGECFGHRTPTDCHRVEKMDVAML